MASLQSERVGSGSVIESDTIVEPFVSTAEVADVPAERAPGQRVAGTSLRSIGLVLLCTIIGAAAQVLLRHGADHLTGAGIRGILTNWSLLAGYACLGVNTALLILALRNGQLSVLYPIIALTYVWVTILSPLVFAEVINPFKVVGVALIVVGVSFIGAGSR